MKTYPKSNQSGFTLVEISIVFVIIGLLIGGILLGRSLIRKSELNSITVELEKFKSAVNIFYDKYNALPGDLKTATSYWGAMTDCMVAENSIKTCNGDGDSIIDTGATATATYGYENFQFWKQLANAELISGNYTGVQDGAVNYYAVSSDNAPSGKLDGSLWSLTNFSAISSSAWYGFDGVYDHTLEYGRYNKNNRPTYGIITPREAFEMDTKFDDGKPGTGNMRARTRVSTANSYICAVKTDGTTLASTADFDTAIYYMGSAGNQCSLLFPNLFN